MIDNSRLSKIHAELISALDSELRKLEIENDASSYNVFKYEGPRGGQFVTLGAFKVKISNIRQGKHKVPTNLIRVFLKYQPLAELASAYNNEMDIEDNSKTTCEVKDHLEFLFRQKQLWEAQFAGEKNLNHKPSYYDSLILYNLITADESFEFVWASLAITSSLYVELLLGKGKKPKNLVTLEESLSIQNLLSLKNLTVKDIISLKGLLENALRICEKSKAISIDISEIKKFQYLGDLVSLPKLNKVLHPIFRENLIQSWDFEIKNDYLIVEIYCSPASTLDVLSFKIKMN
jgi:hypothetical protein